MSRIFVARVSDVEGLLSALEAVPSDCVLVCLDGVSTLLATVAVGVAMKSFCGLLALHQVVAAVRRVYTSSARPCVLATTHTVMDKTSAGLKAALGSVWAGASSYEVVIDLPMCDASAQSAAEEEQDDEWRARYVRVTKAPNAAPSSEPLRILIGDRGVE